MHNTSLTEEELAALSTTTKLRSSSNPGPTSEVENEADEPVHSSLIELHRLFAGTMSSTLSGLVECEASVRQGRQAKSTYSRFVLGQPIPTCCAVVRSGATDLQFYLTMQPTILYPLMDRMLGCKQSDPIPQRPITEIESGLALILLRQVVAEYGKAWQQALSLDLRVDRIAYNANQLAVLPGSEETYAARYEVSMRHDFGHIEICLPWAATRQIRQRLATSQGS